jgi:hypothetical protein
MGAGAFFAGNIAGGALIGGAIKGAFKVVSYYSIENGVQVRNYAKRFVIGACIIGALGGGACTGIASAMIGLESAVSSIAEAGAGEIIGWHYALNTVRGAVVGLCIGMICAGVSKLEAKVKTMGKTKVEAAKQKMSGIPNSVEHVLTPTVIGFTSRYSHTYFYYQ